MTLPTAFADGLSECFDFPPRTAAPNWLATARRNRFAGLRRAGRGGNDVFGRTSSTTPVLRSVALPKPPKI